jgi:hypothetical protein
MSIKFHLLLVLCLCCPFWAQSQDAELKTKELGLTFQQYPTGSVPGLSYTFQPGEDSHHSLQLRLGYNIVYHGNAGVWEDERGGGFGFSPGWLYHFKAERKGLYLGSRLDVWFNSIDWKGQGPADNPINGTSNIVVLQPTAVAGYRILLGVNFVLVPEIAVGAEINVINDGKNVGQGAILLGGLTLARRF